jgi:DNA repair exonuclease SbcCD nuclease subunit
MTIIAVGDLHIMPSNIERVKVYNKSLCNYISENTPEFVVILGDVLHHHGKVFIECMNEAIELFKIIGEMCPVYVIVGNHDMMDSKLFLTSENWMKACKWIPNVTIVDVPMVDRKCMFIPYVPVGQFEEAVESLNIDIDEIMYTFCHHDFINEPVPPNMTIVSGHIHDKQWVGPNVYYPGSAMYNKYTSNTVRKTISKICDDSTIVDVDLDAPTMIYMKMAISEYKQVKCRVNDCINLCLYGTATEIAAFRKKGIKGEKNIKITYQLVDEKGKEVTTTSRVALSKGLTFVDILKDLIKNDSQDITDEFNLFFK